MMAAAKAAQPVLILGMHRSGTSCLAGCLEDAGLFLGEVNRAAPFNRKGNNENPRIMEFHDRVLARLGATWDAPPLGPVFLTGEERAELRAIGAAFPENRVWGVKDPRLLLCLDDWTALFHPRLVGTVRHPGAVAHSLMVRAESWGEPMTLKQALALWTAYNRRLLAAYEQSPFPLIRFDQDAPRYLTRVRDIAGALGLPAPQAIRFFSDDLRSDDGDRLPLDAHTAKLWDALRALSV